MKFQVYSASMGAHTVPKSIIDGTTPVIEIKDAPRNRTVANVIWVLQIDTIGDLLRLLARYSPDGATIFPAGAIHKNLPAIALDDSSNPVTRVTGSTAEEPTDQDPWTPSASTN